MAINFPNSPTDGEQYTASNGAVYVYNATIDNWTGLDVWLRAADGSVYGSNLTADVGIGLTDPKAPLTVKVDAQGRGVRIVGDSTNAAGTLAFVNASQSANVARIKADDQSLQFRAGGTDNMILPDRDWETNNSNAPTLSIDLNG